MANQDQGDQDRSLNQQNANWMGDQVTDDSEIAYEIETVKSLTGCASTAQITFADSGWTSRVYLVDEGRLVVKFPRSEQVKIEYQREKVILALLADLDLAVSVPRIRWTHPVNDFIGYEGIPGSTLDALKTPLTFDQMSEIGTNIGTFLRTLHRLEIPATHVETVEHEVAALAEKFDLGLAVLQQGLTTAQFDALRTFVFQSAPERLRSLGEDLVLSHGDLGYWNMVLGDAGEVGVIDFGDVAYYDRSRDFVGLTDVAVLEAAVLAYGDAPLLAGKMAIRQHMLPILELPFHIGKRDTQMIDVTLDRIRGVLRLWP